MRTAPRSRTSACLAGLASLALGVGLLAAGPASGSPAGAATTPSTSTAVAPAAAPAAADALAARRRAKRQNVATPGDFSGYGFDQCVAPTQQAMDAWLEHSPFLAVGIYISGDSRACRTQPNLSPTWISTQLAKGWRLLPIALGPQASCEPRFPRYKDDFKISPAPGDGSYPTARAQGAAEADKNAADATAYGIAPGSTLWYDLEGFDLTNTHCRESALAFVSAWVERIEALGYVSGFYSSAGSGIKMLDDARVKRPGQFRLPQRIWIARWDGIANTSTTYIGEDGWRPGGRVKQYRGGHNETWGGVTINIDSNYLELGRGSVADPEARCGGLRTTYARYPMLKPKQANAQRVRVLQCTLTEQGHYAHRVSGRYNKRTRAAARAFQAAHGLTPSPKFRKRHWVVLHAVGDTPVLKVGSAGAAVFRLQRALNAAGAGRLAGTGVYDLATEAAVKAYQAKRGLPQSGIASTATWKQLQAGRF
ncbi:glycoside hydrolase domain-containing protein [Nocardioides solisilvae]|uniref:glycoside hydrolase domain-containing protein n=1 Tax=Nocardioides solisilvae TaxID=1542435 RepID=UPI000D745546|nr:glycoside hydrolase domain-containing protein [Nocardioides solisilvae]